MNVFGEEELDVEFIDVDFVINELLIGDTREYVLPDRTVGFGLIPANLDMLIYETNHNIVCCESLYGIKIVSIISFLAVTKD